MPIKRSKHRFGRFASGFLETGQVTISWIRRIAVVLYSQYS